MISHLSQGSAALSVELTLGIDLQLLQEMGVIEDVSADGVPGTVRHNQGY